MSSNLDQSFDSLQIACDHSNEAASAPEPFKPFPDQILPLIFHQLTAFQRCLILSVCRNWNAILLAGRGFWQIVHLPLHLPISTAVSILQTFNLRSGFSLQEVAFEEPSSSELRDLYLNSKPVHLQALERIACPVSLPLTLALDQVLEIDGDQTLLSGTADSLILWKVIGLKAAFLQLSPYSKREDMDILVEKTRKFFQLNPTIQSLTLRCLSGYGGDQYHINKLLEMLDSSSQSQTPGAMDEAEGASSSSIENLTLPHLVKLTIKDATTLDGNLLQKIVKYRRQKSKLFQLEFTEGLFDKTVVVEDWEARGWMD